METETMTKDEEGYNGWTNRETWATALHINNDQGFGWRTLGGIDILRQIFYPILESPPTKALLGMFHDIGSLWRVDWEEIASNFLSEYDD